MSTNVTIAQEYLPTNQDKEVVHKKDQKSSLFFCLICREIEEEKLETSVGKIWALRINSIFVCIIRDLCRVYYYFVCIIGIIILCFSRQLSTITNCNIFALAIVVVIASLYGSITSWIYNPWLQLPISY